VDKDGLKTLTVEKLAAGLQSKPGNEMAGLDGRTELLIRLADALREKSEFFGDDGRPGNMIGEMPVILPSEAPLLTVHKIIFFLTRRRRLRPCLSSLSPFCGTFS
jgi:hypothetical protein